MKMLTLCVAGVLGCASLAPLAPAQATQSAAPASTTPAKSPADIDYEAIWSAFQEKPAEGIEYPSKEFILWRDKKFQTFATASRAFGEKYPNDPRRYDCWVQSSYTGSSYIVGFKPEFAETPKEENYISDEAAILAFRSSQIPLLEKVIESEDATPRHRGGAFYALAIDLGIVARLKHEKFEFTSLRPLVDRVVAKFGDARAVPIVQMYSSRLRGRSAAEADAFEAELRSKPQIAAALDKAAEERKIQNEKEAIAAAARATGVSEIKFTAADGREVDISKLKGKVVLVDFWATWCGPCIAELPNVKKVYAAYHDKGFEVVGITLENPNANPKDTEEKASAKLDAAKKKMLEFTAKNEMPWPQYFDGKWWKNDYAQKFGVNAIPAMFLLDKNGKIASTEARGPKLEAEVKRLLGL